MFQRRTSFALLAVLLAATAVACSDAVTEEGGRSPRDNASDDEGAGAGNGSTSAGTPKPNGGTTAGGSTTGGTTNGTTAGTTGDAGPGDQTVPTGPTTTALPAVAGPVTFDLGSALPALAGAKVTATMSVSAPSGGNNNVGSVLLDSIRVTTAAGSGLLIYRPVIVVTVGGKETSTQLGTNINLQVPAGRVVPMQAASALGNGWDTGATVRLRFSALQTATPATVTGLADYQECKAPTATFTTWANSAKGSCANCHGLPFQFLGVDDKTACGQSKPHLPMNSGKQGLTPPDEHTNNPARVPPQGYAAALAAWRSAEGS